MRQELVVVVKASVFNNLRIFILKSQLMKHILNNLTDDEKNSIRNQHTGGIKVNTDKFSKLVNSKVGDVKPIK